MGKTYECKDCGKSWPVKCCAPKECPGCKSTNITEKPSAPQGGCSCCNH